MRRILAFALASSVAATNAFSLDLGIPYSINPPSGWKGRVAKGQIVLIATNPDTIKVAPEKGGFFLENMVMTQEEANEVTLVAFAKDRVEYIHGTQEKVFSQSSRLSGSEREYNGIRGALTQLAFTNSKGLSLCNTQFTFQDGPMIYAVSFTAPKEKAVAELTLAESVLKTLKRKDSGK